MVYLYSHCNQEVELGDYLQIIMITTDKLIYKEKRITEKQYMNTLQ